MNVQQDLQLAQKQIITQKMLQSMRVLQMSAYELEQFLEEQALENPVIDFDAERDNLLDAKSDLSRIKEDWLSSERSRRSIHEGADCDGFWGISDSSMSLSEYLRFQLLRDKLSDKQWEIITFLIGCIDDRGYFQEDLAYVAERFSVAEFETERLLKKIQSLDPAGVGARSLSECLRIQLERSGSGNAVAFRLCSDKTLLLMAKNHIKEAAELNSVSKEEVLAAFQEIKGLNPVPGNAFRKQEMPQYIRPDALIICQEGKYLAVLRQDEQNLFQVNKYYKNLLRVTDDMEAKKYLQQKIQAAELIGYSIRNRISTMQSVLNIILEKQKIFFERGPGHKRMLTLAQIAEESGMHESTISRTLKGKYLQCAWGIYPLRYFLEGAVSVNKETGEDQTREMIQNAIKSVIECENKEKPYCDGKIKELLGKRNIHISRRTVNKYRQVLGIPDKIGRKAW
jgi:RNA polymerase sigma-54 factor